MDEDSVRIVLLTEEFDEKIGSTGVDAGLVSPDQEVEDAYYEQSKDFIFDVAMSSIFSVAMFAVEGDEETIELEFEHAATVMAGEKRKQAFLQPRTQALYLRPALRERPWLELVTWTPRF